MGRSEIRTYIWHRIIHSQPLFHDEQTRFPFALRPDALSRRNPASRRLLGLGRRNDDPSGRKTRRFELALSDAEPINFRIAVTPADDATVYYVGVTTRTDFDRLGSAQAVAEAFIEIEKKHDRIDWTTPDSKLLFRGPKTFYAADMWELRPKTEYAVVVFGVEAEGVISTDAVHGFAATTTVEASENRLTVSVAENSARVKVTTTNDDPYFLDCIEASRIEGYPLGKLAEHLIGSYGPTIGECIETGGVERDFMRLLEEDTDYCAVAFGYLGGYPTTDIVVVPFHTPGGELVPRECTFTDDGMTDDGMNITVTPADKQATYVGLPAEADDYAIFSSDAEFLEDMLLMWTEEASGNYMTLVELFTEYGFFLQGDASYIFPDECRPGTLYLAFVFGMNEEGETTSGMQKQFFTVDEEGAAHPAEAPAAAAARTSLLKQEVCRKSSFRDFCRETSGEAGRAAAPPCGDSRLRSVVTAGCGSRPKTH